MSMNFIRMGLVFGLLLSVAAYAEEAERKPEETPEVKLEAAEVNNYEEATDRIFDVWYEGKNSVGFCKIIDGYIDRSQQEGQVYLETVFINKEQDPNDLLPNEKQKISLFISRKLEGAKNNPSRRGTKWAFLDAKTRCTYIWVNDIPVKIECFSCFTKEEFAERLQKKQQENF